MEKTKEQITAETLQLAAETAAAKGMDIIVASSTGATALQLKDTADAAGFRGNIVVVTHAYGARKIGECPAEDNMAAMHEKGMRTVTAAHALSGAERGISSKFGGAYPVEIMAHTLRMFGQGVKVCVEIAMMACDNGAVPYGKPVVCIGGTGSGADTICIVSPSYSARVFDLKVNEVIAKPDLYEG